MLFCCSSFSHQTKPYGDRDSYLKDILHTEGEKNNFQYLCCLDAIKTYFEINKLECKTVKQRSRLNGMLKKIKKNSWIW